MGEAACQNFFLNFVFFTLCPAQLRHCRKKCYLRIAIIWQNSQVCNDHRCYSSAALR